MGKITLCPVCGFELDFEPWYGENESLGSFGICPSCRIEFGYHDDSAACGRPGSREDLWRIYREEWIAKGMPWRGPKDLRPVDWNPEAQLRKVQKLR